LLDNFSARLCLTQAGFFILVKKP